MYKITIIKVESKPSTKRGDYTVVNRVPWTEKDLVDELTYGSKESFLKSNPLKEIRDYAPSWQGFETVETEMLKQTVEELDLAAVIKAVNGL
jgi:hypothetical protein